MRRRATADQSRPAGTGSGCGCLASLPGRCGGPGRHRRWAGGVAWRKLEAEGAERFEAAGIHYACTSVEAMLYDQQDVAVVGGGNSAGQAAMYLADCCRDRRVHLLVRKHLGPGMSSYLVGR